MSTWSICISKSICIGSNVGALSNTALQCILKPSEWGCNVNANAGSLTVRRIVPISGGNHVLLSGPLEITGISTDMNNLITITPAATGKRHFMLNGANHKLTLRYLKLEGGDVSGESGDAAQYGGSILFLITVN